MSQLWNKLRFLLGLPYVGEIGGRPFADTVDVDDPELGKSSWLPTILEIVVDDPARLRAGTSNPGGVGGLVHQRFFPDRPRFVFNVCFSCARSNPFRMGVYTDPRSIWFNVFFGFYQIDVPKQAWGRPFAYSAAAPDAAVVFDDILRLGKADWNYFSNYLYGVPEAAIRGHDTVGGAGRHLGREEIGASCWDAVELTDVEVVSAYVAPGEQGRLVEPSRVFTPLWRLAFGNPHPRRAFPTSFVATRMQARLSMAFAERDDPELGGAAYRTLIFGATIDETYAARSGKPSDVAQAENERFLACQRAAIEKVICTSYPREGFAV